MKECEIKTMERKFADPPVGLERTCTCTQGGYRRRTGTAAVVLGALYEFRGVKRFFNCEADAC